MEFLNDIAEDFFINEILYVFLRTPCMKGYESVNLTLYFSLSSQCYIVVEMVSKILEKNAIVVPKRLGFTIL